MNLVNEKVIFVYGLTEDEKGIINNISIKHKLLSCKTISKNMESMTIKDILKDSESNVVSKDTFKEKVILFNNLNQKQLFRVIDDIRNSIIIDCIFAAVTPVSMNWTFSYLLEHLIEEREFHKSNGSK